MNSISIQQSCGHTCFAAAKLEIERQHVGGFDRLCRGKSGTDRFAATGKSREVMKRDPADHKHARKLFQRTIDFNRHSAFCFSKSGELRAIVSIVLEDAQLVAQ